MTNFEQPEGRTSKWSLLAAYNPDSGIIENLLMEDTTKGLLVANYVWDTTTTAWVKETQSVLITDSVYLAVDDVEALLTTIDADTSAMVIDLAAIETLLGTIDTDTGNIATSVAVMDDWDITAGGRDHASVVPYATEACAGGSTSTPLNASSSWTGVSMDTHGHAGVHIFCYADQASAVHGLELQWSTDDTNWDEVNVHTVAANTPIHIYKPALARYMRVKYTNGGTNQSVFRLEMRMAHVSPGIPLQGMDDDIHEAEVAGLVRSVIAGETTAGGGDFVNVKVNPSGALTTEVEQGSTDWVVQETNSADILTALQIIDDWDESDRAKVNLIVGQAGIAAGTGAMGVTVPRVTLATDDPAVVDLAAMEVLLGTIDADTGDMVTALQIMDDWDESNRAKVNPIVGQAGVAAGAGAVGVTVQRVTLASDDPLLVEVQDSKADYFMGGWVVDGVDVYVGFVDKSGAFYIAKYETDNGLVLYDIGTGGLPATGTWSGRAYQTYDTEV